FLAIQFHAAPRNLHVSIPIRLDCMLYRFACSEDGRVQLIALTNLHRAFAAIRRDNQAQLPALLSLGEMFLIVCRCVVLLIREHPYLIKMDRLLFRGVELAMGYAGS